MVATVSTSLSDSLLLRVNRTGLKALRSRRSRHWVVLAHIMQGLSQRVPILSPAESFQIEESSNRSGDRQSWYVAYLEIQGLAR